MEAPSSIKDRLWLKPWSAFQMLYLGKHIHTSSLFSSAPLPPGLPGASDQLHVSPFETSPHAQRIPGLVST